MPDRILRDEILKSRRWWSVSSQARDLWLGVFLSADDACRYTGDAFDLRVHCMAGTVDEKTVDALLAELVAVDLLRQYTNPDGARFLFIPRYRQRKRYVKASHYPTPPNEISDLIDDKSDSGPTQDQLKPAQSQTQDHTRVRATGAGVGVEVRRSEEGLGLKRSGDDYARATTFFETAKRLGLKPTNPEKTVGQTGQAKPENPKPENGQPEKTAPRPKANGAAKGWWSTDRGIEAKAAELRVDPAEGETYGQLRQRCFDAINAKAPKP